MQIEFSKVTINVPATNQDWTVDLSNADSALIHHLVFHALKQKLGDAAAGAKALFLSGDGGYSTQTEAAIALVNKRMETILNVPQSGAPRESSNPVGAEMVRAIRALARKNGAKGDDVPSGLAECLEYVLGRVGEDKFDTAVAHIRAAAQRVVDARTGVSLDDI